jgi:hypothetical protein
MQNSNGQTKENAELPKISEENIHSVVDMYHGASMLILEKSDMSALSEPFNDDEYEIRPDGFIYVPQALYRVRLNKVIGIGQWGLTLFRDKYELVKGELYKIFYDGGLLIRGKFVSRSTGEGTHNKKNPNSSWGMAMESAKSDCMVRCCKDLGIALEIYQPSFVRKWQKEHAIKVLVNWDSWETGQKKTVVKAMWRRKDVEPFENEIGPVETKPSVPEKQQAPAAKVVTEEWQKQIDACKSRVTLTALYNENKKIIEEWPELKAAFKLKQSSLPETKAA